MIRLYRNSIAILLILSSGFSCGDSGQPASTEELSVIRMSIEVLAPGGRIGVGAPGRSGLFDEPPPWCAMGTTPPGPADCDGLGAGPARHVSIKRIGLPVPGARVAFHSVDGSGTAGPLLAEALTNESGVAAADVTGCRFGVRCLILASAPNSTTDSLSSFPVLVNFQASLATSFVVGKILERIAGGTPGENFSNEELLDLYGTASQEMGDLNRQVGVGVDALTQIIEANVNASSRFRDELACAASGRESEGVFGNPCQIPSTASAVTRSDGT